MHCIVILDIIIAKIGIRWVKHVIHHLSEGGFDLIFASVRFYHWLKFKD